MIAQTFERESLLVEQSLAPISTYFRRDNIDIRIKTEVAVGRTIADIVVLLSSNEPLRIDEPLSVTESAVLAALRRFGPTRIDILERKCGVERGELRDGPLDRLVDCGCVACGNGGQVLVTDEWMQDCKIVAIEAKLTRWKDALQQSIEYRRYADEAFVLLPKAHADNAIIATDNFKKEGVGLLTFDESSIKLVVNAEKSLNHSWRREFVYSRLSTLRPINNRR